tara:strand:+ start:605 stop:1072 length:468 start_codon:yes stop_codon:yes gene_type:complete
MKKEENLEISPITGATSVLVETVNSKTSRICMDSGFMTNDDFKIENTELLKQYESSMPQLIKDNRYIDESLNQNWYLSSVQFTTGMIYPMPNSIDGYDWAFSPVVDIDPSESEKYPIPGKEGEFYTTKLDTDATERYTKYDFRGVCKRAGAVVEV